METAFIRSHDVRYLVTKTSGQYGGLDQKWEAVRETDIQLIVKNPPEVDYPRQTTSIEKSVEWSRNLAPATTA
ncbi:MAG: precorrin-6A/cobalt-precorrin-6A reductase, partial [bacterium]